MKRVFAIFIIILLLFILKYMDVIFFTIVTLENKIYSFNNTLYRNRTIVIFNEKYRKQILKRESIYYVEHNLKSDDIVFLIPLFNGIINSESVGICRNGVTGSSFFFHNTLQYYYIHGNCIFFNIKFLKYLHFHTKLFKFCTFNNVYYKLKTVKYQIHIRNTCSLQSHTTRYTIVTSVYKRANLKTQLYLFLNQKNPPNHIIVVHDRNYIPVMYKSYNILYIHAINFIAGYYFRYLMALLSPEENVIIYDDDYFPYSTHTHSIILNKFINSNRIYYAHRIGGIDGMHWCATPILIRREWILLMWLNEIYDIRTAEDAHLSFSLLLLCNILCKKVKFKNLHNAKDNLSSSKNMPNKNRSFWVNYVKHVKIRINTSLIKTIKNKYKIF